MCVCIYIYIYIYDHQVALDFPDSFFLYHPSFSAGFPNRTDVFSFLLDSQHWHVHVLGSIEECHLWGHPCLSSSILHVFLEWFLRWETAMQLLFQGVLLQDSS